MNRRSVHAACAASAALVCAWPALGDDLNPPPWRGGPGTTYQHWDFSAGPGGGAPDAGPYSNPNGVPALVPSNPSNWLPTLSGRFDVWAVNDFDPLRFNIPNDNDPNNIKDVWVQITFQSFSGGIGSDVRDTNGNFAGVLSGYPQVVPLPGGWFHETIVFRFAQCPPGETLTIYPPQPGTVAFIDQVVIDTICVPAPGAAVGMGVIGLAAVGRRRRR
jgi:hypothetical protein